MTIRPLSLSLIAVLSAGPVLAQTETAPDRVGRIAAVTGTVSFHLAGATEWQVASRNLPVTTGLAVWSAPAAEAALDVSGSRIVLGSGTELDVDRLDAQTMATTQPQGETYWHLRAVAADTYVVHTPRGTVTLATDGRYAIASGDTDHPTTITVLDGSATLTDGPDAPPVVTGQELTITGDGAANATASLGPVVEDAFLRHVLAEETPRTPTPRTSSAPAIVAQMTGADALDDVGRWTESAEYGPVWYPPAADYVPYRQGNWAYVAPWGWTWVDAAPWGFAPSHYGRWSRFDGRWGWVPGRDWAPGQAPVYAPALVGFIGGAALGIGVGAAREQFVGWAPLGPREAYRPPYQVDRRTIDILNQPNGATRPVALDRGAITIVPTQILTTSAPVGTAFQSGAGIAVGAAPVINFRPQTVPTRATLGATRAMLQQINPVGLTAPTSHIGAGPTLSRAVLEGPRPEIAPSTPPISPLGGAAVGAAIGAVGGSLLRPPARSNDLPTLRQRGDTPSGIPTPTAQPRPPIRPNLLDPTQNERRGPDLLSGRNPIAVPPPNFPRPGAIATPYRPEPPRIAAPAPAPAPIFREPPSLREQRQLQLQPAFREPPPVQQQRPPPPQPQREQPPPAFREPPPIQQQRPPQPQPQPQSQREPQREPPPPAFRAPPPIQQQRPPPPQPEPQRVPPPPMSRPAPPSRPQNAPPRPEERERRPER